MMLLFLKENWKDLIFEKFIVDDFIGKFVYIFLDGCFINVELVISVMSIGGKLGDKEV